MMAKLTRLRLCRRGSDTYVALHANQGVPEALASRLAPFVDDMHADALTIKK